MIRKPRFERDVQDGRRRRQKQPRPAIQPQPSLMRARRLPEDLHHQPMKLPP
jgi:hypothetical protein